MNKMIKWLGNYWISGAALIMLGFSIALNFGNFSPNDTGIILTFVGIIATLIVVGNYAQVMAIRSDFESKIKESETKYFQLHVKATRKTNILRQAIEEQQEINEKKLNDLEFRTNGALLHLQANDFLNKYKYYNSYSDYVASAMNYYNGGDLHNLSSILSQITKVLRMLSLEEIEEINTFPGRNINELIDAINKTDLKTKIPTINTIIDSLPKTIAERIEIEKNRNAPFGGKMEISKE